MGRLRRRYPATTAYVTVIAVGEVVVWIVQHAIA